MGVGAESAAAEPFDNSDLVQTEEAAWIAGPDEQIPDYEEVEEARPLSVGRPILAGLLILLTLAWLVTAGIVLYRTWEGASIVAVASWVATLCLPLALLALLWLVFGRTSRVETEKFTRAVADMRREARSLDETLGAVAEKLSANRTQLGDETERLMKLGEEASDRLGRVTHYLSRESAGLKARSDAMESAAAQARVDLGVLLTDLPQAEQSARSLSEAMRETGVTAHERARALEAQLSAIAARARMRMPQPEALPSGLAPYFPHRKQRARRCRAARRGGRADGRGRRRRAGANFGGGGGHSGRAGRTGAGDARCCRSASWTACRCRRRGVAQPRQAHRRDE
jgi:uncharacterized membrane protein YgcG